MDRFENGTNWSQMPLTEQEMMKEYTRRGWFYKAMDPFCPHADEVCSHYFINLNVWGRCTFVEPTEYRLELWWW